MLNSAPFIVARADGGPPWESLNRHGGRRRVAADETLSFDDGVGGVGGVSDEQKAPA